jgi:hypothetical protein
LIRGGRRKAMPSPQKARPALIAGAVSLALALAIARTCGTAPAQTTDSLTEADALLVRKLLAEDLGHRSFSFATIAEATSGKKVIPLDPASEIHQQILAAVGSALDEATEALSRPDSPVRQARRINEVSRFFEDFLLERLHRVPGLECDVPPTADGRRQRSGYPDLRITHQASGTLFYLDPKLVEKGSTASTLRSFYFEPKSSTLKITEDAVHLLAGIEHDGRTGAWTFSGWRLVDLSKLQVRLKAEFQASNADLYQETGLPLPGTAP